MVSSKWSLHRFYDKDDVIRKYLPETDILSKSALHRMLERYSAVYIKPDHKHGGKGIIRAWKTSEGFAYIRVRGKPIEVNSIDTLYEKITSHSIDSRTLVQMAIPIAAINGRTYDVRSTTMRMPGGEWKFYGFFAKLAKPSSVVSNVCQQGEVITIEEALRKSLGLNADEIEEKKRKLVEISYRVSKRFIQYKSTTTQIGIDFAFDKEGRIWIVEVNFDLPFHTCLPYRDLPDKSNYYRVRKMKLLLRSLRQRKKTSRS